MFPALSPDGSKLVFVESNTDFDIVSLDLTTAVVTPLIATQRSEEMPSWASQAPALVYLTDRSGSPEIWLHRADQPDRPLVSARDFPPDTTQWFMSPVLSPDATRVIYGRVERSGFVTLWISSVSGGAPVPLIEAGSTRAYGGAWSPDGKWFAYWRIQEGRTSLHRVKTTGQAKAEVLKEDVKRTSAPWVPVWSPAGDWILHLDNGAKLISPDGKTTRDPSWPSAVAWAFSADGQTVYGIRVLGFGGGELFSVNVTAGPPKVIGQIGPDTLPANSLNPVMRLTLAPDGKSVTYSTPKRTSNLWLAEGIQTVAPQ